MCVSLKLPHYLNNKCSNALLAQGQDSVYIFCTLSAIGLTFYRWLSFHFKTLLFSPVIDMQLIFTPCNTRALTAFVILLNTLYTARHLNVTFSLMYRKIKTDCAAKANLQQQIHSSKYNYEKQHCWQLIRKGCGQTLKAN